MEGPVNTAIDEQASETDERVIRRGVSSFSEQHTAPRNWRPLIERAEQLAREGGYRNARVDTFDFEARGFYEKLGY